jgi:hypothetical protein
MANREQRSNREKRKPKQVKPKPGPAPGSSFSRPPEAPKPGKKGR